MILDAAIHSAVCAASLYGGGPCLCRKHLEQDVVKR